MSQVLPSILFWFFFVPFKFHLLWTNYKGRFRYGLWENSPIWRRLDRKIGVFTLALDFILSLAIILLLSVLIASAVRVPVEISLSFVLFGAIGFTSVNMAVDKMSVERFEKNCLQCKHKEECRDFHTEKCTCVPVSQLSKGAILYEEKLSKKGKESG